jgi:hypothetical protein
MGRPSSLAVLPLPLRRLYLRAGDFHSPDTRGWKQPSDTSERRNWGVRRSADSARPGLRPDRNAGAISKKGERLGGKGSHVSG